MQERWSQRHHEEIKALLEHTHFLQHRILERIDIVMTTAAEIKAQLAEALVEVRENTTAIGGMKALLAAAQVSLTNLQAQIDALVADNANDVGADDVAEISQSITEIKGALDEQKALIAVTENTPEEPPVEPAA